MKASSPGDIRDRAWGQVQTVLGLSIKGFFVFFSFGHMSSWWKPGRTLMGQVQRRRSRETLPEQSECDWDEAFRGMQAGVAGQGEGVKGADAGSLEERG